MSLLEALLSFIHFLGFLWHCVLRASFYVGEKNYLFVKFVLETAWKTMQEFVIIGSDFYEFLCRLNVDISSAIAGIPIWIESRCWCFLVDVHDQLLKTVNSLINISFADISNAMDFAKELFIEIMESFEDYFLHIKAVLKAITGLVWFIIILFTVISLLASLYQSANIRQFLDGLRPIFNARVMPASTGDTQETEDADECTPINELDVPTALSCVVCRERLKCILLLPCRHLCLCVECSDYMSLEGLQKYCPLCRTSVVQSLSVYV